MRKGEQEVCLEGGLFWFREGVGGNISVSPDRLCIEWFEPENEEYQQSGCTLALAQHMMQILNLHDDNIPMNVTFFLAFLTIPGHHPLSRHQYKLSCLLGVPHD